MVADVPCKPQCGCQGGVAKGGVDRYGADHAGDRGTCQHIADHIVRVLSEKNLIRVRGEKKGIVDKVTAVLLDNFRQEEMLEKEAERLAEEHLRLPRVEWIDAVWSR